MAWTQQFRSEEPKVLDQKGPKMPDPFLSSTTDGKERGKSRSWQRFAAAARSGNCLRKAFRTRRQNTEDLGLCQECQRIKLHRIFDPNKGLKVQSWRTLNLLAYLDFHTLRPCWEPKKTWRVSMNNRDKCPMCDFFAACSSRMGFPVEEFSNNGYIEPGIRRITGATAFACDDPSADAGFFDVEVLELRVCPDGYKQSPWISKLHRTWSETHYMLPFQDHGGEDAGVSDTVDYEVIKQWLGFCETEHSTCIDTPSFPLSDTIPGLCLIDCHSRKIVPAVGLGKPRYVTLSYVWGTSGATSMTTPTLPEGDELPKIVNDAMIVTLKLGYKYLWVDRYCIPQDDPYAKHIQIQNMGSIYSLSILTIIGAAGEDAEYGLPGVSSVPRVPQLWTNIPCDGGNNQLQFIYFNPPDTEIRTAKWHSRGWTYQEGLLSKRRLVFSDRHVYFQCQEMHTTGEVEFNGREWGYQKPKQKRDHLARRYHVGKSISKKEAVFPYSWDWWDWESAFWVRVGEFMNRTLSYDMDGLDAMKGIIHTYRDQTPLRFVWGLPYRGPEHSRVPENLKNDEYRPSPPQGVFFEVDTHPAVSLCELLGSLFWKDEWLAKPDCPTDNSTTEVSPRRTVLPSWTWAGWKSLPSHEVSVTPGRLMADQGFGTSQIPISIQFSFKDGKELDWITDHSEILARSDTIGKFPEYLSMTGSVFETELVCTEAQDREGNISLVWKYVFPPFLVGKEQNLPPGLFEQVKGSCVSLLGLYCYSRSFPQSTSFLDFHFLLLRKVGEDECGPLYERVTSVFLAELHHHHERRVELPAGPWPPVLDKEVRKVRIR